MVIMIPRALLAVFFVTSCLWRMLHTWLSSIPRIIPGGRYYYPVCFPSESYSLDTLKTQEVNITVESEAKVCWDGHITYLFLIFFNNFLHNIFWSYSSLSPDSSQVLLTSLAKSTSCSFSLSHSLGRKQNRKNNKNQLDKKNSKTNKKVDKATKHDLNLVSVGQLGSPWSVAVTPSDTPLEKTASPFPSRSP